MKQYETSFNDFRSMFDEALARAKLLGRFGYEINRYVIFGCVDFYMRVGTDMNTGVLYAKVTTATSTSPGSGVFKQVLPELHKVAAECGADTFKFDCVLSERLFDLLKRIGYDVVMQIDEPRGVSGTLHFNLLSLENKNDSACTA